MKNLTLVLLPILMASTSAYAQSTLYSDPATGNVGIGTSSPVASLDLSQRTDALALPVGTSGTRPTGGALLDGEIRYNSSTSQLEAYIGGAWSDLATGGSSQWVTSGSNIYYDAGYVGIGTSATPNAPLYVAGDAIFGAGDNTASPSDSIIAGAGVGTSGSNATGANLTIQAGNGTGSGGSGSINFQTAAPAGAGVQYDNGATFNAGSGSGPFTNSYTVGSNSNRLLIVDIGTFSTITTPTATFDGVAMTQLYHNQTYDANNTHTILYLVNPASGTHNLVITPGASVAVLVGVTSFYNVAQTSTFGSVQSTQINNGTTASLTVSSAVNSMVYDSNDNGKQQCSTSFGSGQVANYTCSSVVGETSTRHAGASSVTMTQNFSAANTDYMAVSISPAASSVPDTMTTNLSVLPSGGVTIGTTVQSGTSALTLGGAVAFPSTRSGTFVCSSGGSITVANSNVLPTSNVIISLNSAGGTISTPPAIKSISSGVNFVALCATSDTSTYNYVILN